MPRHRIELSGLAPERLLAMLALYGLMQALETARPAWAPRVAWRGPPWRPVLSAESDEPLTEDLVAQVAVEGLDAWKEAFDFGGFDDIKHTPEQFAAWAAPRLSDRRAAAVAAALASDGVTKRHEDKVQPTPLCAIFGQGHQHFLARLVGNVNSATATPEEMADALFRWRYVSEGSKQHGRKVIKGSLRFDPQEDRRYALAAGDPSAEAVTTVPGANRLAPLGLTLLPVVPRLGRLAATGIRRADDGTVEVTWPVWDGGLDLDALRDLLDLPALFEETPSPARLAAYGVVEVYRCRRLNVGKFMSFSPARPMLGRGGTLGVSSDGGAGAAAG